MVGPVVILVDLVFNISQMFSEPIVNLAASFIDVEFIASGAFDTIYKTGRRARKPLFICEDERVVGRLTREISPSD